MSSMEFWEYEGEPTDEEIQQRKSYFEENPDHLAIKPTCPHCGGKETRWVRQQWNICFDCDSSFTLGERILSRRDSDDDFWEQFD